MGEITTLTPEDMEITVNMHSEYLYEKLVQ
jgi:hypothetical protein